MLSKIDYDKCKASILLPFAVSHLSLMGVTRVPLVVTNGFVACRIGCVMVDGCRMDDCRMVWSWLCAWCWVW